MGVLQHWLARTVICDTYNSAADSDEYRRKSGANVPQLYLGSPANAEEPAKQFKGFTKTAVLPRSGGSVAVTFTLTARDVSIWSVEAHAFTVVSGEFRVFVGESVCDIRQTATFTL